MTALPRYPADIERAVQAEVCPRLLAAANIAFVALQATTTPQGKSDKPATDRKVSA